MEAKLAIPWTFVLNIANLSKTYDKPYNGHMFMDQNFTRKPFITSKKTYVEKNLIFIRLLNHK